MELGQHSLGYDDRPQWLRDLRDLVYPFWAAHWRLLRQDDETITFSVRIDLTDAPPLAHMYPRFTFLCDQEKIAALYELDPRGFILAYDRPEEDDFVVKFKRLKPTDEVG